MAEGHYHFRAKMISRSKGRAICAAAAYRSGEKIHDERYGLTFDYRPRTSIYATEIRTPDHAPNWMKNRSQLWNGVEAYETRKDSALAREFEVSIPIELPPELRQEAIRHFVDQELVSRGMVADIAYHDFTGRHRHNPHAHILVTTRGIAGDTFTKHKTREWNTKKTLWQWREAWARHANQALEKARSQTRIDHRSNWARGIDRPPVNESRGEWYQRQQEIAATKKHLEAVNIELNGIQKEQERQQQERMDAVIQFGNNLAQRRASREAERVEQEKKHQQSQQISVPYTHPSPPEPLPGTDEKALIKHLLDQQRDRERTRPRGIRQHPDEEITPARGNSLEQQTARLNKAISGLQAEVEKLEQTQRQQQDKTRRRPDPQPRQEPDPEHEERHERGIGW